MNNNLYSYKSVAPFSIPPVSEVVLEWEPRVIKSVTKRYPDGRILTLLIDNDDCVEKSLSYKWKWNMIRLKEEAVSGASINFEEWEEGGISVSLTYFGTYLVGKTWTVDLQHPSCEYMRFKMWQVEIDNDVDFPRIDLKTVHVKPGYTSTEKDNPDLARLMKDDIMKMIEKYDYIVHEENSKETIFKAPCEFCGDTPCIFLVYQDSMVENDAVEHGRKFGIGNATRQTVAYQFYASNWLKGPCPAGLEDPLPQCIVTGVREIFPVSISFK